MVSERLLNCPPQLAPPLHQALFEEEIPWATQDEPSAEARDAFRFQRFLLASRVYADHSPAPASVQAGAPKAKRRKASPWPPPFLRSMQQAWISCHMPIQLCSSLLEQETVPGRQRRG